VLYAVRELSSIHHSVTLEMVACEPAAGYASAIHTISLKSVTVTSDGSAKTFISWASDFSNDATSEIVIDSAFKRQEAFADLARVLA